MGITQHRYGTDNVRAMVNLQLMRGNMGRPHTGLMPIRGHSGVQGGAEMGAQPGAYMMGRSVSEENARTLGEADAWGFMPPVWKGMGAAQMVLAAERGELDAMWQSGGDFARTLPEPERVERALGKLPVRIHQDIVASPSMFVEPAGTVILLPTRTRYEQRGGGTETTTERRIVYSPEIPGPRPGEARDEWEIPVLVARAVSGRRPHGLSVERHAGHSQRNRPAVRPLSRDLPLTKKATSSSMAGRACWRTASQRPTERRTFRRWNCPRSRCPRIVSLHAARETVQ